MEFAPCRQFCASCSHALLSQGPFCEQCNISITASERFCRRCLDLTLPWERLTVVGPFTEPWASLIKQLKYRRQLNLVAPMAQLLAHQIQATYTHQHSWHVVAMPMHPQRLKQRGFNQAALIAEAVARTLRLSLQQPLWRKHNTKPLEKLSRTQRQETVRHAFACHPVRGNWILIDDVFTTGASMLAASQVLKQAGADRIGLATLARTPD
jgi:ComF family protein